MKKEEKILDAQFSKELKAFREMELREIDGDILVAASKASKEIGFDPERLQRLQMARDLKRIVRLLGRKKI
jgi:hypothetical protein